MAESDTDVIITETTELMHHFGTCACFMNIHSMQAVLLMSSLSCFRLQLAEDLVHAIAHDRLSLMGALAQYLGLLLPPPLCLSHLLLMLLNAPAPLFPLSLVCLLQQHMVL